MINSITDRHYPRPPATPTVDPLALLIAPTRKQAGGRDMDGKTVTVAGVIPTADAMRTLIKALEDEGFERAQFGMLASEEHYQGFLELAGNSESEGSFEGSIIGGLTYVGALTGLGVAIFSGGGLGLVLLSLVGAGGSGALAGLLAAAGFHRAHAAKITEELERNRLLAWIAPHDPSQTLMARTLLARAGAGEVLECDMGRAA
jgi:hypothetical protein